MPRVRAGVAEKWTRRTASAAGEYKDGVMNPRTSWKSATAGAKEAHKAGVEAALREDRFAKGVAASSDQIWQEGAAGKGADRFAGGVEAGKDFYAAGVEPYLQVINSTVLPPRGPKGDPRNYERGKVLGMALRAKKMGK